MFEDAVKQKKYLKVALFGKGGTGKTRFALSFPKVAIIDAEHSTDPYRGKYDFKVLYLNHWKQLQTPLDWIRKNAGAFETLVIDPMTVFYQDLINELVEYGKNRSGKEVMSRDLWGIEKRRWAAALNQLTDLPCHVILNFRERDVYEEATDKSGQEVLKKTGEFQLDADKQTEYIFDLAFRCSTEENKKAKESKFLVTCLKTRYDWMPKYSVHDVTKKRAFLELFAPHANEMLDAPDAPVAEPVEPILIAPDAPVQPVPALQTPEESREEMRQFFCLTPISPDQPEATLEDIKVLMTRANEMRWPDDDHKCRRQSCTANGHIHPHFKTAEGKSLIRNLYGVESSKELRRPQIEFLHGEFGKVLAGRAFLARDGQNAIYVATPGGTNEEEVKTNVLEYTQSEAGSGVGEL